MWRVWFRTSPLQWCKSPLLSFMWLKRRPYGSHARSCGVPKKFTYTPGPVKPQRLQVQGRPPKCSWLLILGLGRERTLRNHPEGKKKKQKSINNLVLGESMRLCNHTTEQNTHPWVVVDQPVPLLTQQVRADLLTDQVHGVTSALLLQLQTHRRPEGQQAGDAAPVGGPVRKHVLCYAANKWHIVQIVFQRQPIDHTCGKKSRNQTQVGS